jgi:hypothetical protein
MAIQEYIAPPDVPSTSPTLIDIAWLAGLIEGEGSFQWNSSPTIQMSMTDKDVMERVAILCDYPIRTYKPRGKSTYKAVWSIRIAGARAAAWMMTLYAFMGIRRRAKIAELLLRWKHSPGFPRGRKGERLPALCHPARLRFAQGQCKQCYSKEFQHTYRLATKAACHPERTVKGHGLCNPCYLRERRAQLAGRPSLLDGKEVKSKVNTCHPERPHFGKGLCCSCYMKQWRSDKQQLILI